MLLAVDIGNTNISLGVFDGDRLVSTWRIASDRKRMADEYGLLVGSILPLKGVEGAQVTAACICSGVPTLTTTFEEACRVHFGVSPLTVTAGVKTGVSILYDSPRDVGADRIVDAVAAAYHLYGATTDRGRLRHRYRLRRGISPGWGVPGRAPSPPVWTGGG